ncbi:Serine/threonine-protein kinase PknB [Stieleria neptunia]|uniref:Serine/threonine-protein kinase PknB n=1 Tax=Stieleria neptunia TaxID=2527979 RepID=A0A518HVN5_9BACT|nr:serine/threonine-protein kinase [Stieleria neptunia]QDV44921.1 Serine/threonine-protein kinase PknB [Stieleria neptunia]
MTTELIRPLRSEIKSTTPQSRVPSETRSGMAPSLPEMISKSRRLASAFSKLGHCIGDFQLVSLAGEGSFGKVFLARQRSLDRDVALKITADLGHEGRTMARLEHSHVVQVFSEEVVSDRGIRLLCMQYVPGGTLHDVIRGLSFPGRKQWDGNAILDIVDDLNTHPAVMDPASLRSREQLAQCNRDEAACWIGQQLAEALSYAHGRGVLHRDIKPGNIMVNQYGKPLLMDFSLSLPAADVSNDRDAIFGGTIGYMAPEHFDALNPHHPSGPDQVTEQSDLYSLGAVLLELAMAGHERTRPEVVQPGNANVAPALRRIIGRCLEPNKQDRYSSAKELADALSGCFELLRVERSLPAKGTLTAVAQKYPLWFILLCTCVPNLTASAINLLYIGVVVIKDLTSAQQTAFFQMVGGYNVAVISLMGVMLHRTLFRAANSWQKLRGDRLLGAEELREARRQTLRLPFWTFVLGSVGWLPFAITIPLGMELLAGPVDRGVMLHTGVAFVVTGLVGIVTNYYVVAFVVLRAVYMSLWRDVDRLRETASNEIADVPGKNRICQIIAGLTPLGAATLLILVGPEHFTADSYHQFRHTVVVLIALAMAGFWLSMTATAFLNEVVAVMTVKPPAKTDAGTGKLMSWVRSILATATFATPAEALLRSGNQE